MNIWLLASVMLVGITGLAICTRYIFRYIWTYKSAFRNIAMNLSLSVFSILYLFVVLEVFFALFVIQSDRFGFTLACQLWYKKYWNPINSYGYRDIEHTWNGDKVLFVVGDSFVAGHGIKYISERFSAVLQEQLGSDWTVAVLAKNGWDPPREHRALVNHPKKPQRIVVSYYINDIESAARSNGFYRPRQFIKRPHKSIEKIVNNSYFINWVYWRLYRSGVGHKHWDYIKFAYNHVDIWKTHEAELAKLIHYADQIEAELTFVIWPNLQNVRESSNLTAKVASFLESKQIKYIDLAKHFVDRDAEQLVINNLDSHPNTSVNAEVGKLIYSAWAPWH